MKTNKTHIYIGSALLLKLRSVLDKPPSSTNFNQLQVLIIVTSDSATQVLHQACYNSVFYVLSSHCWLYTN